ncbi:unnamed protein product [Gongylonema pulchrum]|uniref:Acyl_transf_3 domain-containing protein n=1 Tax=Gongylonema pulchrum TaxID=637853 RepID=A0A183CV70_9BILA|nr:unnamed protein product [Gongylonema pulchrum]
MGEKQCQEQMRDKAKHAADEAANKVCEMREKAGNEHPNALMKNSFEFSLTETIIHYGAANTMFEIEKKGGNIERQDARDGQRREALSYLVAVCVIFVVIFHIIPQYRQNSLKLFCTVHHLLPEIRYRAALILPICIIALANTASPGGQLVGGPDIRFVSEDSSAQRFF